MKIIETILCVDIGTTSLKTALISDDSKIEAFSKQIFSSSNKNKIADEWISSLKTAICDLKNQNQNAKIKAVCVSGNGPSIVITNKQLEMENENFTLLWNENLPFNTSISTNSIFLPRFLMLKENFPNIWESAATIFSGVEYLIYRLTKNKMTILPEQRFLRAYWTNEELKKIGFSESDIKKIPLFVKMGAFAGNTLNDWGLGEIPVFCGAPDFVVALLGTGTVRSGVLCDRAGSSEGINFCTSKPIFSEKIRTLPSVVEGLWNASFLIPNSGFRKDKNPESLLNDFTNAIEILRKSAIENGETFPNEITMTGGQCLDGDFIQKKANATNLKINIPFCTDAELIGDFILAKIGLGDFENLNEACSVLCKNQKTFLPKQINV